MRPVFDIEVLKKRKIVSWVDWVPSSNDDWRETINYFLSATPHYFLLTRYTNQSMAELIEWLNENSQGKVYSSGAWRFNFELKSDLIAFKLRWV
jgi:hypothetical protein